MRGRDWWGDGENWGGLEVWDLQMTLQKVCYKAVAGSVIIHARCFAFAVLVHFIVFPLCMHEMRNNNNVRILRTSGGITLSCASVSMCIWACVRAFL